MAAIAPGKSRTLHNFSLPSRLSWGTHKLLRCSNDDDSLPNQNPRNASFHPPSPQPQPQPPSSSLVQWEDNDHHHPIEVVREKLIDDFRSEVEQFRATFLGNPDFTPLPPPPPLQSRPWNLRARRSPATAGIAPSNATNASSCGRKRAKFSLPLSRKEIEDDFIRMTGKRPSRKPKKHSARLQRELVDMFPGSYLEEVTADMYKVDDNRVFAK